MRDEKEERKKHMYTCYMFRVPEGVCQSWGVGRGRSGTRREDWPGSSASLPLNCDGEKGGRRQE